MFDKSDRSLVLLLILTVLATSTAPLVPIASASDSPVSLNALPVVASIAANVSAQRIYHLLYDLQNYSTRYVQTTNLNASAEYIVRDYSNSSNLIVQSQYFRYGGLMLRNVIATLPSFNPANKTLYIVGGHYDSWVQLPGDPMTWAPGVDDDASGTVAAMEIARVLSPYRFNATLVFVAWTAEEVGLVGSDYHAASLRNAGEVVGATIAMDMIGNYAGTMGLDLVHDGISEWIADALIQANIDYGIGLQLTKPLSLAPNSDHASFWAHGYPAIMEAEADFSPNWHRPTDTIDNVNITLITRATQLSAAALAEMAGIVPPGVGSVALDKQAYKPGDMVNVTLYDSDLNSNPGMPETATVTAFSDTEPVGENILLTETGDDTGIFGGSILLITAPPAVGELEVSNGDIVNVTYIDADPPGIRSARARVDSVPPTIENVYAVPDVDYATVHWQTNELADSTVVYGETAALGSTARITGLRLGHSVLVSGLKPGTRYYYDVQSADEAGNLVVADNAGAHYSFVTLYGFIARPKFGYIGYVRSNNPTGNFFTAPDVLVGQGVQGTYLGAAQLDTSSTPIPSGATIVKATFEILGREWIYEDLGQWNLRLLNSSIDAGWTTHGYTLINGAVSDATILPTLTHPDLLPGKWNVFTFQPSQYGMLRARVNTGTISFRMDGPRSSLIIFTWNSGNDFPSVAPRLRVAYSMTNDVAGPLVTELAATPNPTMAAPSSLVNITVSDESTGGSNLSYAEYYWGADPGLGLATPLLPDDGGYDSPTEKSSFTIDVSSMSRGIYVLGFRGKDQSDNWGPTRTLTLYVGVWDLFPPTLDQLAFNPSNAESGTPVNISVRIKDDIAVHSAFARITHPSLGLLGNFTMSRDSIPDRFYYVTTNTALGTYSVVIWANDTSNKWNSAAGSFNVVDTTDPLIVQVSANPPIQNYGMTVTLTGWVVDRFLSYVKVAVWDPAGMPFGNFTATYDGPPGDNYSYMIALPSLGQWNYCFYAIDTTGNIATSCDSFTIIDGIPPIFISVWTNPAWQYYGQPLTIGTWVIDPYISSVWVNVTGPGPSTVGNFSMSRVAPWSDNWTHTQQYFGIGLYSFVVWAYDSSGNKAHDTGSFAIVDMTSPVFDSVIIDPNPASVFDIVAVSVHVTDAQPVTVSMAVLDPSGGFVSNSSMVYNSSTDNFESTLQVSALGSYRLVFWAVDLSFNKARHEEALDVVDATKPAILILSQQTSYADSYNDVNITVRITDNYAVQPGAARIEWRDPTGSVLLNTTLIPLGGTDYYYEMRLTTGGRNHYSVMAVDTSGNVAVVEDDFDVILDVTKPDILVLDVQAFRAESYNDVNITFRITDNFVVRPGTAKIEWRDPVGSVLVNATLVPLGATDYYYNAHLLIAGQNQYTVMASDAVGNVNITSGGFDVVLGQPPTAVAGDDKNLTLGASIVLNASASDDDFGIVQYVWRIVGPDTNVTLQGEVVNFTFTASGTYTVTLTVYDSAGHQSTDSLTAQVKPPESPGGGTIDMVVLLFIALIVVIAIAMILLVMAKRRRKEDQTEDEDEATESDSEEDEG